MGHRPSELSPEERAVVVPRVPARPVSGLTDADWAGLCALTESNRPEEQEYVLWVIRSRVVSPRFPNTYEEVVLQPKQFSAFNLFTEHPAETSHGRVFDAIAARQGRISSLLGTVHLAEKILGQVATLNPFAPPLLTPKSEEPDFGVAFNEGLNRARNVLHYYSPVSMKPPGSAPVWAKTAKYLFTPPGIDPNRFIFAEGVL